MGKVNEIFHKSKITIKIRWEVHMSKQIKIGIVGYGNLGRGTVEAIKQSADMELIAIFTRRAPESLKINEPNVEVVHISSGRLSR